MVGWWVFKLHPLSQTCSPSSSWLGWGVLLTLKGLPWPCLMLLGSVGAGSWCWGSSLLYWIREKGVLLQTGVHVASGLFGHEAKSCGWTPLMISIAPMLFGRQWSRCANIAWATDWPIRLPHRYAGGMRLTCSAGCAKVNIVPVMERSFLPIFTYILHIT